MAVRMTNLVMGKMSYEDTMRIQTFWEIGFGYLKTCYKFSDHTNFNKLTGDHRRDTNKVECLWLLMEWLRRPFTYAFTVSSCMVSREYLRRFRFTSQRL